MAATEAVIKGKCISLNAYILKELNSKINYLNFYFKKKIEEK